jgi:short-subunit dehydrogenase
MSLDDDISMIRLNVEAGVRLTKRFLPAMLLNKRGRILNTAYIAGFEPGPLMAIYHATKAFVLSWSEALTAELQETGVTLTVLCPGPMDTKFEKIDMVAPDLFPEVLAPHEIAATAYKALMEGEQKIIPGAASKALAFASRFLPETTLAKIAYEAEVALEGR